MEAPQQQRQWQLILGIGGSFNPPHVCHIEMLKHARTVLQSVTGCSVLWGCLAAATDSHVQAKTDMAIKAHHRIEMLKAACSEQEGLDWVRHSDKTYYSSSMLMNELKHKHDKPKDVHIVEVWGGDYIESFVGRHNGLSDNGLPNYVVFGRVGYTDNMIKRLKKTDVEGVYYLSKSVLFVDWGHDVSSTKIRNALTVVHSCDDEEKKKQIMQELVESKQVCQAVCDYILEHERSLYLPIPQWRQHRVK